MEFINMGGPIKIRIGGIRNCHWSTIRKGEVVDLTQSVGLSYGFSIKTTEGQIGNKKVETKQIENGESLNQSKTESMADDYTPDDLFFKELCKIKGIGKKTARDIIDWGTKEKLIEVIAMRGSLPFRDDIENLLRENYGR